MRRIINSTYMSLDGVVRSPEVWTFGYRDEEAANSATSNSSAATPCSWAGTPTKSSPDTGRP